MNAPENTERRIKAFLTIKEKERLDEKTGMNVLLDNFFEGTKGIYVGSVSNYGDCWLFDINLEDVVKEEYDGNEFYTSKDQEWVVHKKQGDWFLRKNS